MYTIFFAFASNKQIKAALNTIFLTGYIESNKNSTIKSTIIKLHTQKQNRQNHNKTSL